MRTVVQPAAADISLPAVMGALADPVRVAIVKIARRRRGTHVRHDGARRLQGDPLASLARAARGGRHPHAVEGTRRYTSLRRDALEERFPGLLDALLAAAAR